MVSESLGNSIPVSERLYCQPALLRILRMIPSGALTEGYNGAFTESACHSVGYASFNLLTAIWATPSLATASSTFRQLLTYSTHQELCQNAAVPFNCTSRHSFTFLVIVFTLALWWGLGIPDHSPLMWPAEEDRDTGSRVFKVCWQIVLQDLINSRFGSKLALKLNVRSGRVPSLPVIL